MTRERLECLADRPFSPTRMASSVGRRGRRATIKDVAKAWPRDWDRVKELDQPDRRVPLARAGTPAPTAIGSDERAIRTGHPDRIVVRDLARRRPIWFGGHDRFEERLDECSQWLGSSKSTTRRPAVLDRWKAFRHATRTPAHAPQAAILFDTFHVMRPLGDAVDAVRTSEDARVTGKDRRVIKGQHYTRRSHRENLKPDGRRSLRRRRTANTRVNTASLLQEEWGTRWDDEREGWARRFFENWSASLTWQRRTPDETFAEMIDRHGDGIVASCQPEHTVALGFVEGLNHTMRVIQRRAYGRHDEEYLRLKILTCLLPGLYNAPQSPTRVPEDSF